MELQEAVKGYEEQLLKSLQESIRIRSVQGEASEQYPYGKGVPDCLDHALKTAEALGFATIDLDHQMGWCEYGEGEEMVAVLGHLDVVPEGDGWSFDPFGGEIRDGKVFGRGAMDDKGPTIAALYALAALRDSGLPIRRRIRLLFGTNEETGSNDMKYYRSHGGEIPVMGFTPDGEYPVINGEKGLINVNFSRNYTQDGDVRILEIHGGSAPNVVPAETKAKVVCPAELAASLLKKSDDRIQYEKTEEGVQITAAGLSAHGATPELGVNAIGLLLEALCELPLSEEADRWVRFLEEKIGLETKGTSLGIEMADEISGNLSLNLGTLEGNDHSAALEINYRYPVTKSYEDCAPILEQAFADAGFTKTGERHKKSLYVPEESELVQTLLGVYADHTGLEPIPKSIGGGTYAKAIPNIVAFGPIFPGDEVREHKPDEFIEVEKLMKNAQISAEAMYRLAK